MKNKWLVISVTILMEISFVFLLHQMVPDNSRNPFREIESDVLSPSNAIAVNFELFKDAYFLKIKHRNIQTQHYDIFFNGRLTNPRLSFRGETGDCESRIYLPREAVREGTNILTINYQDAVPSGISVKLTNYRKNLDYIYILFADSTLFQDDFQHKLPAYITIIIFFTVSLAFIGITQFGKRMKFSLLLVWFGSFLFIILLSLLPNFGYKIALTPIFFWNIVIALFFVLILYSPRDDIQRAVLAVFKEKQFSIPVKAGILLVIAVINLWVYWSSFFHIFRHDEWFFFFSSKNSLPDLGFIFQHIDWQLSLPYDRLIFRPIHHGLLAVSRVVFDTNYVGPHIATFAMHIAASGCLMWLMCQFSSRAIAGLFALLFSVLMVGIDAVMLPHFHAYILATIFMLMSIAIFTKTIRNQISPLNGFGIISLFLFLNMLTAEIAFLMPFCFFASYWLFYRNRQETNARQKNKAIWVVLFAPMILWSILFSIHIYFAYPDFKMTSQSNMIPLWKALFNIVQALLILVSGIFFPFVASTSFGDKTYLHVTHAGLVLSLVLVLLFGISKLKVPHKIPRELRLPAMLFLSILTIFCLARASYTNGRLDGRNMPTSYCYPLAALAIFMLYILIDFAKIAQNRKTAITLLCAMLILTTIHGSITCLSATQIEKRTAGLKNYFDAVRAFVETHKNETCFSFKIIDRSPNVAIFNWYHETCIDGLFNRFINNQNPRYVLEYDPDKTKLKYYPYTHAPVVITDSNAYIPDRLEADYTNSIGMQFKKIPGKKYDLLMGVFEVTQRQWKQVMDFNPSKFVNDELPVENVSWYMVQNFINRLHVLDPDCSYRLPTIDEYLYLANLYHSNLKSDDNTEFAWLKDNSDGMIHPVGRLTPVLEAYYDLIGNVWEWTNDPIDYQGIIRPFESNPRFCFGGSWRDKIKSVEDFTTNYPPDFRHENLGFRLVIDIKQQKGGK